MPEKRKAKRVQIAELAERLAEAEETLRALRDGEVDAIVAAGPEGDRVYTLKGADESYRIMVEDMAEGALTLTEDGLILFSNSAFAAMLRQPLARVTGSRLAEHIAERDAALVSALIAGSGKRKAEVLLAEKGGETRPVSISIQNMTLSGGACRCVIVTDLSHQKRYSEVAAVLDAVPAGVFIANDVECRNMRGNRAAYAMLRMEGTGNVSRTAGGGAMVRNWHEVKDGRELPVEELAMQKAARTGKKVQDFEFEMQFDDGVTQSWLGTAVPLFDGSGKPCGAVGSFIDFTERRRTAEELAAANEELRNLGRALTKDLLEPLQKVGELTRMLVDECIEKAGEEVAGQIAASVVEVSKMEGLLEAMAAYLAVTDGGSVRLTAVDCNLVLEGVLARLANSIQSCGAKITAGPLPILMAEEGMMDNLLKTLIENAIQYRGRGRRGFTSRR